METAWKLGPPEVRVSVSRSVTSDPLQPHGLKFARFLWDSPGKNTGVGCHSLLQGIFLNLNLLSPLLQAVSLLSEPPGKPKLSHSNLSFCLLMSTSSYFSWYTATILASLDGSDGKETTCSAGDPGFNPWVGKIPLEEDMATHSVLAWRIPWTEEPGGLHPMGSQGVGHVWVTSTNEHVVRVTYAL